jgi:3-dehydrosphinganine reductase
LYIQIGVRKYLLILGLPDLAIPCDFFTREGLIPAMIKIDDFIKKNVLITGGSSGIGLAAACLLAQKGANVWLLARPGEKLVEALKKVKSAAKEPAQSFGVVEADVVNEKQVRQAISRVIQSIGVPDLVINSAGVARPGYVQKTDLKIFHWMMDVNFFGTVNVIKELLPGMIERESGYIVNISSMAGLIGLYGYSAYGASKYAVRGFSDVLRAEMKPHGIGVSVVFPPDTDTPQLAYEKQFKPVETNALTGTSRMMTAESVAQTVLKGIERGKYLILPGIENKIIFRLTGILINTVYPVMDWLIAHEQRNNHKVGK